MAKVAYSYVRFSSPRQARGDSLRRQVERSEEYARRHGLVLDTKLHLQDVSLSGYSAANVERGALGQFLQAVKDGKIAPGSTLLVESLDRISRNTGTRAHSIFMKLIDAGINIVTLVDGHKYTPDSDHNELMMSIGVLQRAYDESRTKSDRGRHSWDEKKRRARAEGRPMSRNCPPWLKVLPDKSGFSVIKERAAVVVRVFKMCAEQGMGVGTIARVLNEEGVKPFSMNHRSSGFAGSYLAKLLKTRAVIGEFQPGVKAGGKRGPDGEPIKSYYPPVVDVELFFRAQASIAKRRAAGGDRAGPGITNLFSKVAYCHCGSKVHVVHKETNVRYLTCERATKGMGCARTYWRLRDLEKAFLTFVRELDLSVLSDDGSNERDQLAQSIQADEGRLEDLRNQRAKCIDAILVVPESRALLDRLKQLEAEIVSTERQLSTKTERIRTIVYETQAKSRSREQVRSLIEELQKGGDEVLAVRSTLRAHLRDIIDRIELHMGDPAPVGRRWSAESRAGRAFAVHFRDGTYRVVYPQGQDPTKFEMIWHTPRTSSSGP